MLTTGNIQKLFDVSAQTVRNWTREFQQYLSPSATPQSRGSKRAFTSEDLAVFALVVERTQSGATYEEIRDALEKGERAAPPEVQDEDVDPTSLMTPREIALTMSIMRERDIALGKLEQIEADRKGDRDTIERLNREIGRLQYQLDELRKKLDE